jgi:hypothetical protein
MRVEAVDACCSSSPPVLPQFLGRDIQVALRLLDAGVAEHQLDVANVDAVGEKPTPRLRASDRASGDQSARAAHGSRPHQSA